TAGSVVGAFALYGIGAVLGLDRLRALVKRLPLLHVDDVDRTVAWFGRHGGKAVFFGRMLPIFRSLISIPAGVVRMPLWRFGLLTLAGSFVWNTVFVLSGYLLGEQWHIVEEYAGILQYVVIAAAAAALVWFAVARVRRLRGRQGRRRAVDSDPA
ncbi:DedA family protein, partial [Microbacterium lacticum]|uniref:DedA family protein n=1 Tax=Microbacterium lacticum TaxID=33885 RepID=UPI001F57044B